MVESTQVVCAVILREDKRILICQRASGKSLAGLWEFPGGKIERGERARSALERELKEELQITVAIEQEMQTVRWADGSRSFCLRPFWCRWLGGDIVLSVHSQMAWCLPQELSRYQLAPADQPICKDILDSPTSRLLCDF